MLYSGQKIGRLVFAGICDMKIGDMGRKRVYLLVDSMRKPLYIVTEKEDHALTEEAMMAVVSACFPDFPDN